MEEKEKEEDFKDKLIRSKSAEIKKQFIPLPEGFEEEGASYPQEEPSSKSEPEMTPLDTIAQAVLTIIRENSDEDGWVFISDIGTLLLKRYPDFDVRNFGFKKLTPFVNSLGTVEVKAEKHGNSKLVYAREKEGVEAKTQAKKSGVKSAKKK